MMKDLKYMAALTIPHLCRYCFRFKGQLELYYARLCFCGYSDSGTALTTELQAMMVAQIKGKKKQRKLFDWMLYLNIPIVYGLLFYAPLGCGQSRPFYFRIYRPHAFHGHCSWHERHQRSP